jgi:catechol 2,3-dioxygenase-like lactoylglutathione lyase family enzyme
MLQSVHPKLPMRQPHLTKAYYVQELGFEVVGDYGNYLLLKKEGIEIHFFHFPELDPLQNYGQVYIRTSTIKAWYMELQEAGVEIHPNDPLSIKPWGQWEFSLLDPDGNLLTFAERL